MKDLTLAALCVCAVGARSYADATPFSGTPVALPATIQGANFDNGGEGVAYHDTTSGNTGGAYRSTDVDLQAASDGGYNVGWIDAGEWLNYTVSVITPGTYNAVIRVASPAGGGTLHVGFNGPSAGQWKSVSIPATGDWQAWATVTTTVTLAAGVQQMTILFDTAGYNFESVAVSLADAAASTASAASAFGGAAVVLPGQVLAANFDNGGEGIAYHDTSAGNVGGQYRTTDVDIEQASDGGFDVGWIDPGEWLNYTVNVGMSGNYNIALRVASPFGASFHVGFNGPSAGTWKSVSVPATGGWQNWTTVNVNVGLAAGQQLMTLYFDTGGLNLETIDVQAAGVSTSTPQNISRVSTPTPSSGDNVVIVAASGDLQAALNDAQPGDTIVLQAGATYTGNFTLPAKSSSATDYITITSSGSDLPGSTTRMDPKYAPQLAKIQSPNSQPAIATAPYAHHYQLVNLEFPANYQGYGDVIDFGDGSSAQNTLAGVPHDLIADRLYIHGDPTYGQKRGIGVNSASTTVKNSYIASIMAPGQDSQAICGWNGPGPFTIDNNYLEGAGENLLFGGADPAIPQLVPSDITITHNYFTKQPAWMGSQWQVKNILELKNAQRVVIDGNVLEYNWLAAQAGSSVLFTPRNQDGTAPWTIVQHVQFTNNVVRHVSSVFNILGTDNLYPSQQTNDIVIRNNLLVDVSSASYGGSGRMLLISGGQNITVDHNTVFNDGGSDVYADTASVPGFTFTNNIMPNNAWAIMGGNASPGSGTVSMYFSNGLFQDSVIVGAPASSYPTGNFYPSAMSDVGFIDVTNGNYRLSSQSSYKGAGTDGRDIGADIDALNAAAGTSY